MNDIQTIDPEVFLASSKAQLFIAVWTNSQGSFIGTGGGGFQNAAYRGSMPSPVILRNNAVEEYYNLVRAAKSHTMIKDGRVDLVELPSL